MIAIIGVQEDDILYFKAKMAPLQTIPLIGDHVCYRGKLGDEEVVLLATGRGDYFSAMLTGILIKEYGPYIVYSIGSVASLSPTFRQGDLFIPERIHFADVDFSELPRMVFGQVEADRKPYFVQDSVLNNQGEATAYRLASRYVQRGYLFSGEKDFLKETPLLAISEKYFKEEEAMSCFDSTSAGVSLACDAAKVPCFHLKVISYEVGNEEQKLNYYRKGLEAMPEIGRIITGMMVGSDLED